MSKSWDDIKKDLINNRINDEHANPDDIGEGQESERKPFNVVVDSKPSPLWQMISFAVLSTLCFGVTFYIITRPNSNPPAPVGVSNMNDVSDTGLVESSKVDSEENVDLIKGTDSGSPAKTETRQSHPGKSTSK